MPTRVTHTETKAAEFFSWGFERTDEGLRYPHRVCSYHRWPNLPYASKTDKLIDITGTCRSGRAFSCEVKQWDSRKGNHRFSFGEISPEQRAYLGHEALFGARAYLWLGVVIDSQDRRKVNHRMFLIPWMRWLEMENVFYRVYKNGKREPWRSISLPWIEYFFKDFELVEVKYRPNKRLRRAWFTRQEVKRHRTAKLPNDTPPRGMTLDIVDTEKGERYGHRPDDPTSKVIYGDPQPS